MASLTRWRSTNKDWVDVLVVLSTLAAAIAVFAVAGFTLQSVTLVMVILGLALTLIQWPRRPALRVYYQAKGDAGERNSLPRNEVLVVWLENTGHGPAESMEAGFGTLGGSLNPDPDSIYPELKTTGFDVRHRWVGETRSLNPDSRLPMAELHPRGRTEIGARWAGTPRRVEWWATAKGIRAEGTIELKDPPDDA